MTAWDLEPGNERPVNINRKRAAMPKIGLGAITPNVVADRCEALGARVDRSGQTIKVYPEDTDQSPVFFSNRFSNGTDRANAISRLKNAGLDVLNDLRAVQKTSGGASQPAEVPGKLEIPDRPRTALLYEKDDEDMTSPSGVEDSQIETLFETLVAADAAINELKARVAGLEDIVLKASKTQSDANHRITELERRLDATPGAAPKADPFAELDEKILEFMTKVPIKLTASVIASNLEGESANQVGKRLQSLATRKLVSWSQESSGTNKLYFLPSSDS